MTVPVAPARILYIDDDPALRRLVALDLARHDCLVTTAASGDEGMARLTSESFDLVALDHHMPGKDGLQVLAQVRALEAPPPVIYVTGSEDSRLAVAALKAGAADYVIKAPGTDFFDLLRQAIRQALHQVRLARQKEAAEQEMRAANERLEKLVAQQTILLREVNHRVANSLQIIASLVRMQAASLTDSQARDALVDTQYRIEAIMQVHRRLYTSDNVEIVEMNTYLSGLLNELRQSMAAAGHNHELLMQLAPVSVPTDKAVSLGVIVAELVTNAYKYAYPPGRPGPIRVSLAALDDGRFALSVEDDGVGMPTPSANKGTGLGQRVIQAMAKSLDSEVEIDGAHRGTRVRVVFPL